MTKLSPRNIKSQPCRLCGKSDQLSSSRHHVVPLSWYRNKRTGLSVTDRVSLSYRFHQRLNLIVVCRECHDELEHRHTVRRGLARWKLRCAMNESEREHAISLAGLYWFNNAYPRSEVQALGLT